MYSLDIDYIHIGYRKVASTFLQRKVFPRLDEGFFYSKAKAETILYPTSIREKEAELKLSEIRAAKKAGRKIIFSAGRLAETDLGDRLEAPELLHKHSPNAKIFIFVRSQYSIIPSFYYLYGKGGAGEAYARYVNNITRNKYFYDRVVKAYIDRFAANQVKVMLYEDLCSDQASFIRELGGFFDIETDDQLLDNSQREKIRPSPSDLVVDSIHWANRLSRKLRFDERNRRSTKKLLTSAATLVEDWIVRPFIGEPCNYRKKDSRSDKKIRAAYAESNRRLFELIGKDIGDYSYPQP